MASEAIPHGEADRLAWRVMFAYWLAQFAAWLALLTPVVITIAIKVSQIAGEREKAESLGLILGVGAAVAMISAPIWGAISDRTRARMGRRKPWIIFGSLSLLIGLTIMATASHILIFGIGWLICQLGSNAAQAALNAVMSDIVPERQHGLMSALLGAAVTAAIVTGVFLTQFTTGSPLAMFLVPWLVSPVAVALFLAVVPDTPASPAKLERFSLRGVLRSTGLGSLRHWDFAWALASRFLVMFGAAFSMTYQVYYLTDHLHVAQSEVARYMVLSTSLMGCLTFVVSCFGGWLSDRTGRRKPFVAAAAIIMGAGLFYIAIASSFDQFLIGAALASIGQGLYYAVDIALCVEVLPDKSNAARDMAVLQIANSLPQSLAPAVAPLLLGLTLGGVAGANYGALFAFASFVALAGAAAVGPIRKAR